MAFISIGKTHVAFGGVRNVKLASLVDSTFDSFCIEDFHSGTSIPDQASKHDDPPDAESSNLNLITCGEISPDDTYLACVTNSKLLFRWEIKDGRLENLTVRNVPRRCVKLRFTHDKSHILVADRSGDVYRYNTDNDMPGELLLGHVSMLLDMRITSNDKFVITSDRDEKIRVSHYPNAYNIHTFCLRHQEFVSSLDLLPVKGHELLISGSGDGHLVLWDYERGCVLSSINASWDVLDKHEKQQEALSGTTSNDKSSAASSKNLAVKSVVFTPESNVLAVSFFRCRVIAFYKILTDYMPFVMFASSLGCPHEPRDMQFDSNSNLWVLTPSMLLILFRDRSRVGVYYTYKDSLNQLGQLCRRMNMQRDLFKDSSLVSDDLEIMYKQHYDNVAAYMEKKKEREKEKSKRLKVDHVLEKSE